MKVNSAESVLSCDTVVGKERFLARKLHLSEICDGIAVNLSFSFRTPTKYLKKSGTTIKRENESSSFGTYIS